MNAVVRTREVAQPVIVESGKASSLAKGETGEGAGCVTGANASAAVDCNANAGTSDGESGASEN